MGANTNAAVKPTTAAGGTAATTVVTSTGWTGAPETTTISGAGPAFTGTTGSPSTTAADTSADVSGAMASAAAPLTTNCRMLGAMNLSVGMKTKGAGLIATTLASIGGRGAQPK
jgi:hypothetical protein